MILGTLLCCVSLAVSFWWISQDTYHPPFSLSFCAVLVLAVWLRARTFPLTLQRAPLLLVSAWGLWCTMRLTVGLWPESRFPVLIGLAVLAVWLVLLQTVRIPEHVQARWRRLGHVVETLAVVALIPLLIGYVGLYGAMLEAF